MLTFFKADLQKENRSKPRYVIIHHKYGQYDQSKGIPQGDRAAKGKSAESGFLFFSLARVFAATDNLSEENKLGEGGFGPVYKVAFLSSSLQ